MRNFINLRKNRQIELREQFPDLYSLFCVEGSDEYRKIAISVFDHWQGAEEYQNDYPDKEEKLRRDNSLHSFLRVMSNETEVLNFKFRGKWGKCYPLFRQFTSKEAMHSYLKPAGPNDTSNKFCKLVLPELSAVFFEGWDYTNIFYYRNPELIPLIKRWAAQSGVYCLEFE